MMRIRILATPQLLGAEAAHAAATVINKTIADKGEARIALSTGASQFETLAALVREDVDWSRVTMFHLDEYVGLPETQPASFRKYLKERFISQVKLKRAFLVNGEGDVRKNIAVLNREISAGPIDLALIGIGENGHIAFNDPPARFDALDPYIIVDLNETCKKQQVGEGWFAGVEDVPAQAVSMSCYRIMMCDKIISCVPHAAKADAIRKTFETGISELVPATLLKFHPDWTLYIDKAAASKLDSSRIKAFIE
jgi:glucosamine-6-phosphate deaminase